jgi:hypothetical protein
MPVNLVQGQNDVALTVSSSDLSTRGSAYDLDLVLLDTNWAAIQVDVAKQVARLELPNP